MSGPAFLDNLRRSRLLSDKQLAAIAPLAAGSEPNALAKVLVQKGWMTPFQVRQVAAGKPDYLRLGDYILQERVGEGAMGEVYRASHLKHGTVALKVLKREKLSNPSAVKRFFQEIELAAKLRHPNIVRAIDSGLAGDSYYLAMEFIDGVDLSKLVKQDGQLGIEQACHYIRQAALALHYAHERGVVHRDLKPGNLMIDRSGTVKLLDLGLARLETYENNNALTRLGQMIGSPDYLAPEQALDARRADARADIYSLGCALFYLVAGKPPFTASSLADLLIKHQTEAARPLKQFRQDAPDWLVQLIGWMMNKKPEDRPASALEVAQKIEQLLPNYRPAGPPPLPPPPPPPDPWAGLDEERPAARNRRGVGWFQAALIGLLVLGLSGAVAWYVFRAPSAPPAKDTGTEKKLPPPPAEEKQKPQEKPTPKPQEKPKAPAKVKGVAEKSSPVVFKGHAGGINVLAVSPDGKWAATAGADRRVFVWDLAKKEEAWSKAVEFDVLQLQFRKKALDCRASGRNTFRWDRATGEAGKGKPQPTQPLAPQKAFCPPFEGQTSLLKSPKGSAAPIDNCGARSLDFHRNNNLVLVLTANGPVVLGRDGRRDEVPKPAGDTSRITRAIWGPEGEQIIVGTESGRVFDANGPRGPLEDSKLKPGGAVTDLALSRDGKRLLVGSRDGGARLVEFTEKVTRVTRLTPVRGAGAVTAVAFASNQALVAYADGSLRLLALTQFQ